MHYFLTLLSSLGLSIHVLDTVYALGGTRLIIKQVQRARIDSKIESVGSVTCQHCWDVAVSIFHYSEPSLGQICHWVLVSGLGQSLIPKFFTGAQYTRKFPHISFPFPKLPIIVRGLMTGVLSQASLQSKINF